MIDRDFAYSHTCIALVAKEGKKKAQKQSSSEVGSRAASKSFVAKVFMCNIPFLFAKSTSRYSIPSILFPYEVKRKLLNLQISAKKTASIVKKGK